tara:strand:- start:38 stop:202 length:165 start_codon:yes stop_codon:yes gene_type:complete
LSRDELIEVNTKVVPRLKIAAAPAWLFLTLEMTLNAHTNNFEYTQLITHTQSQI